MGLNPYPGRSADGIHHLRLCCLFIRQLLPLVVFLTYLQVPRFLAIAPFNTPDFLFQQYYTSTVQLPYTLSLIQLANQGILVALAQS